MNIDFHHAVTYLVARLAGFDHDQGRIISHSAQYVDDATNNGLVRFDNGAAYFRSATAHRMLDYKNFAALANNSMWLPFHFLPGNGGRPEGETPEGPFIERLITRPNSHVAQAMVKETILDQDRPYSLHRLGIMSHVYVDTWAHQGFAGVSHRVNQVREVRRDGVIDDDFTEKVTSFFNGWFHQRVPPVGHGAALAYPDRPWLVWSYVNGHGEPVRRNNIRDFTEAAHHLCKVYRRYLLRDPDAEVEGLPAPVVEKLLDMFREIRDRDEFVRHERWLKALAEDAFGIGSVHLSYRSVGVGSWRYFALGAPDARESKGHVYPYTEEFLHSDWKKFHDAAKAHRRSVVDDILPRFGVVVA